MDTQNTCGAFSKRLVIHGIWEILENVSWVPWLPRKHYYSATQPSLGMVEQELCSRREGPFLSDGALPLCAAKDLLR